MEHSLNKLKYNLKRLESFHGSEQIYKDTLFWVHLTVLFLLGINQTIFKILKNKQYSVMFNLVQKDINVFDELLVSYLLKDVVLPKQKLKTQSKLV